MREDWLIRQIRTQYGNSDNTEKLKHGIEISNEEMRKWEEAKDKAFRMGMMLSSYSPEKVQEQIANANNKIQLHNKEKTELEKRLRILKKQRLNDEGLRRFCQLAKDNINNLTKNQWQLLNKIVRLKVTAFNKKLVVVDAALPVMSNEFEFNHL